MMNQYESRMDMGTRSDWRRFFLLVIVHPLYVINAPFKVAKKNTFKEPVVPKLVSKSEHDSSCSFMTSHGPTYAMKDLGDFGRYQFLKRTSKAPGKMVLGRLRRSFPFEKRPSFRGYAWGLGLLG